MTTKLLATAALCLAAAAPIPASWAAEIRPAIVFDLGGKYDKSFNEGVSDGATAFSKATGIAVRDFEPQNDSQRAQGLRTFAQRGFDPILAVGFSQATALTEVAKQYPNTHFVIIDSVVDAPNVQSILFREEQGSYLAGVLAAMASKDGKVGFVGGMDVPLIRRFACGYVQGAKSVDPKIDVLQNMTGTTGAAWNDPVRGGELARSQIERGADVIYAAAGATGLGVLKAAAEAGKLGIGVDSNQNGLYPGHMLTSMTKRVDVATQKAFTAARDGTWKPGVTVLGLKEGGVALAFDAENASLVTPAEKQKVEAVAAEIGDGTLKVHDYMADGACPE
jgi:basic membrane protein A